MDIAIDFDHTLVDHDKLLPGAKEAVWKLKEAGHYILIHSCNTKGWIEKVLNDNDVPYDYIWSKEDMGKPVCACYIDDRAIHFNGNWKEALDEVEKVRQLRGAGLLF